MNPEFRRQLWLQFSPARLATLPLLLLASSAAVYLSAKGQPAQVLAMAGAVLFTVLVWGMGTLAAGASVLDEVNDRTWDQQRMSAMQPWAMTWGKLAGSTAYGWYGGAICLFIAVPSAMATHLHPQVLQFAITAILTGVFLHALLIAVNLQLAKTGGKVARRGGVWALVLFFLWGLGPVLGAMRGDALTWWNVPWGRLDFALASIILFACCAVGAAWRSMAEVLAVRQLPWAWPALALTATTYLTGFAPTHRLAAFGLIGLGTSAALTYFALVAEPQQRPLWQRVISRWSNGQWRAALLQIPRWPTTLLLAMPFAVLTTLTLTPGTDFLGTLAEQVVLQPVVFVLLMARDCALALYFAFAPKGKRPLLAFAVLMLVLYGLLPWLLGAAGLDWLVQLAQPLLAPAGVSMIIAAIHLLLALGLLRWRWAATAP